MSDRVLSRKDVESLLGISSATLYRWENNPLMGFPQALRLGPDGGRVGYLESEILDWLQSRKRAVGD